MRLIAGAALLTFAAPAQAWAHESDTPVSAEPILVGLVLGAVVALYALGRVRLRHRRHAGPGLRRWDLAAFAMAIVSAAVALVSPFEAWTEQSFAAHMAQHMILITLTTPLLVFAHPLPVLVAALGRGGGIPMLHGMAVLFGLGRARGRLPMATGILALSIWGWHVPAAFRLALADTLAHALQHVTLVAAALYFWHAVRQTAASEGRIRAVAALLVTLIHSGMLGGLITFARRPFYTGADFSGDLASALADQQLAGLIMWVPACAVYVVAALWVLNGVIVRAERRFIASDRP